MTKKSGKQIRLGLYAAGNVKCPICLTPFTKEEVRVGKTATLEHVPPKAVGGSVMCLTCTVCNAGAGGGLDQAAAMANREVTGQGTKVRINICGGDHTTYFLSDSDARAKLERLAISDPATRQLQRRLDGQEIVLLTKGKRGAVWDPSKGITMSTVRPPWNQVKVSELRSAYLMVFSLLGRGGYRYAESEAIRPIREQIMKPDEELVPCPLWSLPASKLRMASKNLIIMKRNRPVCWIAKIGNRCVLLPHAGTAKHYNEVVELPDRVTREHKGLVGWSPVKFGQHVSLDLPLYKDSEYADKDLFGMEITIPAKEYERQFVVVNQQGLICTFLPIGLTRPRRR